MKRLIWNLLALFGAALLAVSVASAQATPAASHPTILDWLGLSGLLAIIGWAVQFGEHREFKKATLARVATLETEMKIRPTREDLREWKDDLGKNLDRRFGELHDALARDREERDS